MMVQVIQGTEPLFAILTFLFIAIATAAFNLAGGFSRTSGSYVFFYSVLAVILGLCTKVFVGEPGDTNLLVPLRTMLVYVLGISGMYLAVFASLKVQPSKGFLEDVVNERNIQNATVGSLVAGFALHAASYIFPRSNGSLMGALAQINMFLPMTIILGTIYEIRRSGGRRSVSMPVLLAGGDLFIVGLYGFSKQGMFTPFLCWIVAAASQRYRLTLRQIAGILLWMLFMFYYIVPYAQLGRSFQDEAHHFTSQTDTVTYLLSNLGYVREQYNTSVKDQLFEKGIDYYNINVGLFDRLQMIGPDDKLINVTETQGQFGMLPIYMSFANLVPHAIWPNKPFPITGNTYAHEVGGIVGEDDYSTGISFSPTGEAYHLERWLGVIILAPVIWFAYFTLMDSLCGDTRRAPWGLLIIVYNGHVAPEGLLGGVIYSLGFAALACVVAAYSSAYLMPIIGTLVKGPERTTLRRIPAARSIPGRSRALPESI